MEAKKTPLQNMQPLQTWCWLRAFFAIKYFKFSLFTLEYYIFTCNFICLVFLAVDFD